MSVANQDHPRGCGENHITNEDKRPNTGSPPRMRGKLVGQNANGVPLRITPADAGKTSEILYSEGSKEDHPRGCGENYYSSFKISPRIGSPPRMRGKQEEIDYTADRERITPADAGKTCVLC